MSMCTYSIVSYLFFGDINIVEFQAVWQMSKFDNFIVLYCIGFFV